MVIVELVPVFLFSLSKVSILSIIIAQFFFMYFHLFADLERPEIICYIGNL